MSISFFQWPVRVYYKDTNAGGVVYHAHYVAFVYHAHYVAFYERARTEMLHQHNFHQHALMRANVAFVVRRMAVEYFSPARLDDLLQVESEIVSLKRASLPFAQRILNADGQLLRQADVVIACVDLQQLKPIALPMSFVGSSSSD